MAMTLADVRRSLIPHRIRLEAIGVSLLAMTAFVILGLRAHRAVQPARADLAKLTMSSSEVSAFRASFRTSGPEQELRISQMVDSLAVAMPRDSRVTLAQQIAARAEALGLSNVRVKFAELDSAAAPVQPGLTSSPVVLADYSMSIDCSGGFAALLSLVNQLPASVALQRLTARTEQHGTQFHLTLAVFEAANTSTLIAVGHHG